MSREALRSKLKRTLMREIQRYEFDLGTTEIAQKATAPKEFSSSESDSDMSVEMTVLPTDDLSGGIVPQSPSSSDSQESVAFSQIYDHSENCHHDARSRSHCHDNCDKDTSSSGEEGLSSESSDTYDYYNDSSSFESERDGEHTQFQHQAGNSAQSVDTNASVPTISESLVKWSFDNFVTHKALDELLVILREHGHSHLPKTAVTLLQTPRNPSSEVVALGSGEYWYHGVLNGFQANFQPSMSIGNVIEIDFFVDGFSPYNRPSKNVHLWPIAGRIICKGVDTKPFVIALWCGSAHEPDNIDDFLDPFVNECLDLMDGFVLNGVSYKLRIRFGIADAPARSLIKKTKQHQSHVCCERCEVRCSSVNQTMVFPITTCKARTDESFKNKTDNDYHKGTSPLEKIMKMITQFPLEPLHLVDIGVTKRFLKMLVKRKASRVYLKPSTLAQLDNLIGLYLAEFSPSEFGQWKPKALKNYSSFKGKELKRFLKYDGILSMWLLEQMLPNEHKGVFALFLGLSMGVRILSDNDLCLTYADDANYLLKEFVKNSVKVFGPHFVVFNVHHLTHLADDCKLHGSLDNFDVYPYESCLGQLGRFLHAPGRPLPQIIARTLEREKRRYTGPPSNFEARLSKPHCSGPTDGLSGESFEAFESRDFTVRVSSVNDHCFLTKSRDVVIVENIVKTKDGIFFVGRSFIVKEPFFERPLDSTLLNIFKVKRLGAISHWPVTNIQRKCFLMPIDLGEQALPQRFMNGCLAVPFTH